MSTIPPSGSQIIFSQLTKQITEQETAIFREGANASELVNGEFFKTTLQPLVDSLKTLKEYQEKGVSILQKSKRVKPENIETFKTSILNEESRMSDTILTAFAIRMELVETRIKEMAAAGNIDEMGVLTASYVSYFESQLTGEDSLTEQFLPELKDGFIGHINEFIGRLQALNSELSPSSGVSEEQKSSSGRLESFDRSSVSSPDTLASLSEDDRDLSPLGTSIQSIQDLNSTLEFIKGLNRQIQSPGASKILFPVEVKEQLEIAKRELASTMGLLVSKHSKEEDSSNKEVIRDFIRTLEEASKSLVAISTFVNRPVPSQKPSSSTNSSTVSSAHSQRFETFNCTEITQRQVYWTKYKQYISKTTPDLQSGKALKEDQRALIERVCDKIIEKLSEDIPALEELATRASLLGNREEAKQTTDKKVELMLVLDQARTAKEFLISVSPKGSLSKPPKSGNTGREPLASVGVSRASNPPPALVGERKGSINPSNLCYLNSACTLFTSDYAHLLSNDVVQIEGESEEDFGKRQTLQTHLREVAGCILDAEAPVPKVITTNVFEAIRAIKSDDRNWSRSTIHTQNTSGEALNIMINALSDVEGSTPIIEEVFFNSEERDSRSEKQPSLSLGLPASTQETTRTGYVNQDVEVPFGRLVESYFSVEGIPDHATYTNKQARLRTAPPALSFEIKRAVVVGDRGQQAKNLSHITDIPSELDVRPYLPDDSTIDETRYRLTGFSLHSGLRSTSGHYITVSFNPRIDRWELLSDSYVKSFESFEKLKEEVEARHLSPLRDGRPMNFGQAIAAVTYKKI
jgi:hypothetical protein